MFEVADECGDGGGAFFREGAVSDADVIVVVPGLSCAVPELYEADAAFDEASGHEDLAGLYGIAVPVSDAFGFAVDVEGVGGFHLHSVCEFVGLDACFEFGVSAACVGVAAVEFLDEVELFSLFAVLEAVGSDVGDEFFDGTVSGVDVGSLIYAGQEGGLPVLG